MHAARIRGVVVEFDDAIAKRAAFFIEPARGSDEDAVGCEGSRHGGVCFDVVGRLGLILYVILPAT